MLVCLLYFLFSCNWKAESHVLAHSSNKCSNQGWVRPKSGTQYSIYDFHMFAASSPASLDESVGSWAGSRAMGFELALRWSCDDFNTWHHNTCLSFYFKYCIMLFFIITCSNNNIQVISSFWWFNLMIFHFSFLQWWESVKDWREILLSGVLIELVDELVID